MTGRTELDTAMSDDDDDDRNLEATLPPDANDHTSVPLVPAKLVASGQAEGSATGQSLSDRSVKPRKVNNSSQQSVQDDGHGLQDLDRTITACPDEAGSDGLSAGCFMELDGGPDLRWKTSIWSQLETIQPHRIRLHGNGLARLQGRMRRPSSGLVAPHGWRREGRGR